MARPAASRLAFLVRLDVVLEVHTGVDGAVFLLRLVLDVDRPELDRHALHRMLAAARRGHARNEHVLHLDDQVVLLALARLAGDQRGFLDVLTGGARLHQDRRRLVERVHEAQILEVGLAGAAAAARRHTAGLRDSPRPGEDIDLSRVLAVLRFTLDVPDLQEHVYSHALPSSPATDARCRGAGFAISWLSPTAVWTPTAGTP